MKKHLHLIAIAAVTGLAVTTGCSASSVGDADDAIKIGLNTSLTGAFATLGEPASRGVELAVEQINEDGGIDGREIELTVLDDASDPNKAVSNARRLISEGVVAVLGGGSGNTVPQTASVTGRAKVLHLSHIGPNFALVQDIELPETYFGTAGDVRLWAEAASCYATAALSAKRIAIIHTREATGELLAATAQELLGEAGHEVVAVESVEADPTADTSIAWTKIREAEPDAVLNFMVGAIGGSSLKTAVDVGVDAPRVGFISNGAYAVQHLAGAAAYGNISAGHLTADDPADHQTAFVEAFKEKFPDNRSDDFAAHGYDSVMLLKAAIESLPEDSELDGETLAGALEAVTYRGVAVDYDYEPMEDGTDVFAHAGMTIDDLVFIENVEGDLRRAAEQPSC